MSSGFSTDDVRRMLGLSTARLRAYVRDGLLCPQRGEGGELRFSFQDLLLLRTAEGLVTDRLPPHRVRAALRRLRRHLPTDRPLTGVQLRSDGAHVVVRDGDAVWQAESGQVLLSFSPVAAGGAEPGLPPPVAQLHPVPPGAPTPTSTAAAAGGVGNVAAPSAVELYQLGCDLEERAPEAALIAYQRALATDPLLADAHVNLGRLLHEAGDLASAERHYRAALAQRPADPTALFNLGVVLEDRGQPDAAVAAYEAALAVDAGNADAHYNAARLHEQAGRYEAAVRHLHEFRRLTRR